MEAITGFVSGLGGVIGWFFVILLLVIILILVFKKGYVKAPPDTAVVISGRGKEPRFIVGTSGICIPFLERRDTLVLNAVPVNLKTTEPILTSDFIELIITATVNVKIDSTDRGMMAIAAQTYINKDAAYIANHVSNVLEGNLREIAGHMSIHDLVKERQKVAEEVKESAEKDMQALGLTIKTFNISAIEEMNENGVISSISSENIARILKDSSVSKAENSRIVREEKARNEQLAKQAETESLAIIAERENNLRIQLAELKAESDKKQADANIAGRLQEEQRRRELEQASVQADIARREQEAELAEREIALQERKLDASIKKQADADRYKKEQEAEANRFAREKQAEAARIEEQNKAEAELIKAQKDAEAQKARAEAAKFAKLQEAEGIKAVGIAEAAKVKAVGEAKAAALEKEAEAMEKLGQAALGKLMIENMPAIAHEFAAPMSNIGNVSIIGGGNDSGIGTYMDSMPLAMGKFFQAMKETTGLDMADLMAGESKSAQVERNVHIDGLSDEVAKGIDKAVRS